MSEQREEISPRRLVLTLDDGPSDATGEIVAYLSERKIPAVFFCRGDRMEPFPDAVSDAIRKGMTVGSHLYSHRQASSMTVAETIAEIEKTEPLIDAAYARAGVARAARYLRFPHLDHGMGTQVVEYEKIDDAQDRERLKTLFGAGLKEINPDSSPEETRRVRDELAAYLERRGFSPLPCPPAPPRWFRHLAAERNAMFTFSTADWKLTERHRGRHADIRTAQDVMDRIDSDPDLNRPGAGGIVLMHDQAELLPAFRQIMDHFIARGFLFVGPETVTDSAP